MFKYVMFLNILCLDLIIMEITLFPSFICRVGDWLLQPACVLGWCRALCHWQCPFRWLRPIGGNRWQARWEEHLKGNLIVFCFVPVSYMPESVNHWKCFRKFSLSNVFASLHACTGMSQPYRIDIFEDYIYGTGLKNEVFRIHKYGKKPIEPLDLGIEKTTNVLISQRFKQQDGKSTLFL